MKKRCRGRLSGVLSLWVCAALPACGTTSRYVDQPQLTIDALDETPRQAAAALFGEVTPYRIKLCDADPESMDCLIGSNGIRAHGVGGLFIPLMLTVNGMTVSNLRPSESGWAMEAAVESKADAIPPLCRTAHGQILVRDDKTAAVELRSFYCNWLVVGNVLVNMSLSIDHVDAPSRSFTGYYRIVFHGTGNVAGSGYYRAGIVPRDPRISCRSWHMTREPRPLIKDRPTVLEFATARACSE